jgi:hypothetical protein
MLNILVCRLHQQRVPWQFPSRHFNINTATPRQALCLSMMHLLASPTLSWVKPYKTTIAKVQFFAICLN